MSKKSAKIADLIQGCQGRDLDAHYLGYFECFNRQLFYEAHDVLEELWLPRRKEREGDFYKGLIQLAGAFVHMQKKRLQPAEALLRMALCNLRRFSPVYERLDVEEVIRLIHAWRERLREASPVTFAIDPQPFLHVPESRVELPSPA